MQTPKIVGERRNSTHIEYAVKTQSLSGSKVSQSWRSFSEFRDLHFVFAERLQLPCFPATKLVLHTPAALARRRALLQVFLDDLATRTAADETAASFVGGTSSALLHAMPELQRFLGVDNTVMVSGTLVKRGYEFPFTWRQRYCLLLRDGTMDYFDNEAAAEAGTRPKGRVIVIGARQLEEEEFGLAFSCVKRSEMRARAPSAEEQARWLSAVPSSAARLMPSKSHRRGLLAQKRIGVQAGTGHDSMIDAMFNAVEALVAANDDSNDTVAMFHAVDALVAAREAAASGAEPPPRRLFVSWAHSAPAAGERLFVSWAEPSWAMCGAVRVAPQLLRLPVNEGTAPAIIQR